MKTQLKVQLLGSAFTIQSDETREHVEDVLEYYQTRVAEVLERNPGTDPVKIALLAGLNVADELLRLKKSGRPLDAASEGTSSEIDTITRHLIDTIDTALDGE
jgi:cell division protein ZapA (FtsZ GTPase activity inhibitor)